jgi:hypothetical protein
MNLASAAVGGDAGNRVESPTYFVAGTKKALTLSA